MVARASDYCVATEITSRTLSSRTSSSGHRPRVRQQCPATHGRAQIDQFGHGIDGHTYRIQSVPNGGYLRAAAEVLRLSVMAVGDNGIV